MGSSLSSRTGGAIVNGPSARDIREAYAVRAELEGFAAELAVSRIRDEQLQLLRETEELFRHSIQGVIGERRRGVERDWSTESEWERANNLFHQVIQEAAANRQLLTAIAHLHQSFPRHLTWSALSQSTHLLEENIEQHHRILAAIEARDAGEARRAMAEHVRAAGELVAGQVEKLYGATRAQSAPTCSRIVVSSSNECMTCSCASSRAPATEPAASAWRIARCSAWLRS